MVQPVIPLMLFIVAGQSKDKRVVRFSWFVLFFLIMMYYGALQ